MAGSRVVLKEEMHSGRFCIGQLSGAVRKCLYLHVFQACCGSVTFRGEIWYSAVNKQITLICNVGLSWWLMGYPLLQNSVCRKNKTEIAHANDKGCGENSAQDILPGEAATVEIFVWQRHSLCTAMHFSCRAEVLCWADSGIYQLCNYPVALACPTKGDLQSIQS